MNFPNATKRTLLILIFLLVLDMVGFFALWFAYSTIEKNRGEEIVLRKNLAAENQKGVQLAMLQKTLKQAERESGALTQYFYDPGEESQIRFIADMEGLGAAASGAVVETRSINLTQGASPSFHAEFSLSGTWKEVYHFLRLVETFPSRLTVERFSITLSNQKGATAALWSGGIVVNLTSLKSM